MQFPSLSPARFVFPSELSLTPRPLARGTRALANPNLRTCAMDDIIIIITTITAVDARRLDGW